MFALLLALFPSSAFAFPSQDLVKRQIPAELPIPGQYEPYNTARGGQPPIPGNLRGSTPPTEEGPPGPDDALFQQLLHAEWGVVAFYQYAVDHFSLEDFTKLGFPNDTMDRLQEIRNNEAGHLNILANRISPTSTKPGPCQYTYNFTSPTEFLARQIAIEASGTAFLPGLTSQAQDPLHQATLTSVTEVEVRHSVWALLDIWNDNPFTGPADTYFPYPLMILANSANFEVPGSCPRDNPPFPADPRDQKPIMDFNRQRSKGRPGEVVQFTFPAPVRELQPKFEPGKEYWAVFFHGLNNISCRYDVETSTARVPTEFDKEKGIILGVIAEEKGAPTRESVSWAGVLVAAACEVGGDDVKRCHNWRWTQLARVR